MSGLSDTYVCVSIHVYKYGLSNTYVCVSVNVYMSGLSNTCVCVSVNVYSAVGPTLVNAPATPSLLTPPMPAGLGAQGLCFFYYVL